MEIKEIQAGKEYQLTNVGNITILSYKAHNPTSENGTEFGADMIFKFDPLKSFGGGGDTFTFVQIVADDFSYKSSDEKTIYTWIKNKLQNFTERNYTTDGQRSSSKEIPLNYSIDQYFKDNGIGDVPDNHDFRYPEIRTVNTESLSTQEKKVSKLLAELTKPGSYERFNLEELKDTTKYNTPEKKKAEIIRRLNCDDNIVPEVVYSAFKSAGTWQPARMADSPRTYAPTDSTEIKGSQHFETLLLYDDKNKKKLYALCTIYWGWEIMEDGNYRIIPVECKAGLPEHWENAKKFWNACNDARFKIPDIEVYA